MKRTLLKPLPEPALPELVVYDNTRFDWSLEPVREDWDTSIAHHWFSACGRYRVTRLESTLASADPEPIRFGLAYRGMGGCRASIELTDAHARPRYRRTLAAALEGVRGPRPVSRDGARSGRRRWTPIARVCQLAGWFPQLKNQVPRRDSNR